MRRSGFVVRLEGAGYAYPGADAEATGLGPYSVEIFPGEVVGIVGPSGAGKSTVLGLLGGLLDPQSGARRVGAGYRGTAFVLQTHAVHPYLTAWENVAAPWGVPSAPLRDRAVRVLRAFDLDGLADRGADRLSGGQRQRLAVARAVASKASVIIADEPTGSLDAVSSTLVLDALTAVARGGRAVVVATHDDQVRHRCDRIVELSKAGIR